MKYQYRRLAEQILEDPTRYEWSLQGFGMLRFYITQEIRLHIWDSRYRVGNVSGIHTHPWHFTSTVLAGQIEQYRYHRYHTAHGLSGFDEYVIRAGEGGGLEGIPTPVLLRRSPLEIVKAGDHYKQRAEEIHLSQPVDGTVTIVFRELADPKDADHAYVYVPAGEEWVSAEPRVATEKEIFDIAARALFKLYEPEPVNAF